MSPRRVVCIPRADTPFCDAAAAVLSAIGARVDPKDVADALVDGLRDRYPAVSVHRQDPLASLPDDQLWYAYRDGKA